MALWLYLPAARSQAQVSPFSFSDGAPRPWMHSVLSLGCCSRSQDVPPSASKCNGRPKATGSSWSISLTDARHSIHAGEEYLKSKAEY